jgi:hypothetical protein
MLTQEEYRTDDRADQCPQCHARDYTPGIPLVAGCQIELDRWCNVCEFGWSAVFRIAGYLRHGQEENAADVEALHMVWCVDCAATHEGEQP